MSEPLDWQLIDRYLAGQTSPDESDAVRARMKSEPAWSEAVEMLRADYAAGRTAHWNTDRAWSSLRERAANETTKIAALPVRGPGRTRAPQAWRIAAGLLVATGALTFWRLVANNARAAPNATQTSEIVTPNGARRTVTLIDGSRVTLNAGSRLTWNADFNTSARDVTLDGEAFFVVTHDAARPFRVHARGTVAHDLGTRFAVRAYAELPHVEVIVAEGAVSLRHDRAAADSAVLTVGQRGRLTENGQPIVDSNVPVEPLTAWTAGSLVFESLTLAEVVPQLERWFDVDIAVPDDSVAAKHVSARFRDETLAQVLDALTLALGAHWQQTGRTVTVLSGSR